MAGKLGSRPGVPQPLGASVLVVGPPAFTATLSLAETLPPELRGSLLTTKAFNGLCLTSREFFF